MERYTSLSSLHCCSNTRASSGTSAHCCRQTRIAVAWAEVVAGQGLTSHQTHYRSYRGRIFTDQMTTQQRQSTEGSLFLQTRLQSHQVHPTVLIIMNNCSVKQKHRIAATWGHTDRVDRYQWPWPSIPGELWSRPLSCLLYTSDAADE